MLLDVEIISASLNTKDKCIEILAIDTGERRLEALERNMAVEEEPDELEFVISLENPRSFKYACRWLSEQKAVREADRKSPVRISWGDALYSVIGTRTTLSSKYRIYNY